jgi:predicted RecB family nuclease
VREQPVTVRGAFAFGLKAITKAMHAAGLIGTNWRDGVTDGLGAMVGAWWCDDRARERGGSMRDEALLAEIEAYNRVDVEAMRDVLDWLRRNR